jgi:hypothetical protein
MRILFLLLIAALPALAQTQPFRARSQGMTEPAAARAVEVLLHPERGIRRDLSISTQGVTTVLRLRSAYAQPPRPLTDPARYMDDRLRQRALAPN